MRGRIDDPLGGLALRSEPDFRQRPAGAVIGIVTNNTDPEGQGRVKVRFPWLHDSEESHWARIAQPYAGAGRGSFWLPEVGDEVVVVFDRGDPSHPYVLGGVWNGEDAVPPPGNPDGENNHKIWRTRNGHQLIFEDTDGGEKITLIDGVSERHLVIDVAADTITLTADPGDITFEAPQDKLTVACKDLEIDVKNSSTWKVDNNLNDQSDTRQETITGADSIQAETTWTVSAPSTSVSATSSSIAAQTIGVSVSGGLTMTNVSGRNFTSKSVQRTTDGAEVITAPQVQLKAEEGAMVANGPITVTGIVQLKAAEATFVTGAALTVNGGVVNLKGATGISGSGSLVKLS